jgi:hypothetical protein
MLVCTSRFQENPLKPILGKKKSAKFVVESHLIQKFNYLQYRELQAQKIFRF